MTDSTTQIRPGNTAGTTRLIAILAVAAISLAGCGPDGGSGGGNAEGDGQLTVTGELSDYDSGEQTLSPNTGRFGEGTLNADGTFEVTLTTGDELQESAEPAISDDDSLLDGFNGFLCKDEALEQVGTDVEFAAVAAFAFIDDGSTKALGLTSAERPGLGSSVGQEGNHVRWLYASKAVTIETTCRDGNSEMDLELNAGWNEYNEERVRHPETIGKDKKTQYTDDRPTDVEWKID
jgi:hypothetical protein